jgi:hypothetical protein
MVINPRHHPLPTILSTAALLCSPSMDCPACFIHKSSQFVLQNSDMANAYNAGSISWHPPAAETGARPLSELRLLLVFIDNVDKLHDMGG